MRRRDCLGALISAGLFRCATAEAQPSSGGPRRIGVLTPQPAAEPPNLQRVPFEQGLRQLGWIPGSNVLIEYFHAEGNLERLNQMARDMVARGVDVIIARGTAAAVAARDVTNRIPIILAVTPDPVRTGLVASLAQPGGNITGLAFQPQGPLEAKQLELLKDGVTRLRRVAVLVNPLGQEAVRDASGDEVIKRAAATLDLQLARFEVRTKADIPDVLERIAGMPVDALLVRADPQILVPHRAAILAFALQQRFPAIYPWKYFVEEGGLMSFGPSLYDLHIRSASFVDRIFRGEDPAMLPVELPTRMEFVINKRTADALGLEFPSMLMAQADEIIE